MVTETNTGYTSPAGKEFTLTAGRLSCIHPGARVLDMGCGYGEGACNLAQEFRCRVTAVDTNRESIEWAQQRAIERGVSHLIDFRTEDILQSEFPEESFEAIFSEGGVFSLISREEGLKRAHSWLGPRGWLAFSDLIVTGEDTPPELLEVFENDRYRYETEASYRELIQNHGFNIQLICLAPQSGWDNYYARMAKHLEDDQGQYADPKVKLAFHREIDIFYRLQGLKYVAYMFSVVRKHSSL